MADVVAPMMTEVAEPPSRPAARWRVRTGPVAIALFWVCYIALDRIDLPMFYRFLAQEGICVLACLVFLIWWLCNRSVSLRDRFLGVGALAAAILVARLAADKSLGVMLFVFGVPLSFSAWALWIVVARGAPLRLRRIGLVIALLSAWGFLTLFRAEGLLGSGSADWYWRWAPTSEELYLAELARASGNRAAVPIGAAVKAQAGDWPEFRGPARDSKVVGERTSLDWRSAPPKEVWRRRIGWGWSSISIVGERLFTQEQRGDQETVLCLEAASGGELWAHHDSGRFGDDQSGVGPRATPTIVDGRLYALGGTGLLNCLDAATGMVIWKRDLRVDAGVNLPLWGFSSSPLVVGDLAIVFAGGDGPKSLLAYRIDNGEIAWTAEAGKMSYSSAQLAALHGVKQVLFLSDRGLMSYDPASGALLWEYKAASRAVRSLQPQVVGLSQILIGDGMEEATALLDVIPDGSSWKVKQRWKSGRLRPSFNDFVVDNGNIYGFDKSIFCCIDLETGELRWKDGRYGFGQALLLADQHALVVVTDEGEVVLVAADPSGHNELGRFRAINGKTWNHPVVAHGRLYVRNGQEMACFELPPDTR